MNEREKKKNTKLDIKPIIKGVLSDFNSGEYYFGRCLYEDHENFFANMGEENWCYCPKCKIKWRVGWGILSDPPEEVVGNLINHWTENKKMLEDYEYCS